MNKLYTERLNIIPLDLENFRLYLEDMKKLQENLGVMVTGEELSPEMKEIFSEPYQIALSDRTNVFWYSDWQIVLKEENKIIGGITFKGKPDENGVVEIGYGLDELYHNKGYMTETVSRIIEWAFSQDNVNSVIAETERSNIPSQRVLEKVSMKKYKETDDCYWYRIDKNKNAKVPNIERGKIIEFKKSRLE